MPLVSLKIIYLYVVPHNRKHVQVTINLDSKWMKRVFS